MSDYEENLSNAMNAMITNKRLDFKEYINDVLNQKAQAAIETHVASYSNEDDNETEMNTDDEFDNSAELEEVDEE